MSEALTDDRETIAFSIIDSILSYLEKGEVEKAQERLNKQRGAYEDGRGPAGEVLTRLQGFGLINELMSGPLKVLDVGEIRQLRESRERQKSSKGDKQIIKKNSI